VSEVLLDAETLHSLSSSNYNDKNIRCRNGLNSYSS